MLKQFQCVLQIQSSAGNTSSVHRNPLGIETGRRLYDNREKTGDIKFKCGTDIIPAHKNVLAAFSPKYEQQFYGSFDDKNAELIELDVSAAAFKEFLQFFYLDRIELTNDNIPEVVALAKQSLVTEFYDECIKCIAESLSTENVCQHYRLALFYNDKTLMEFCERKIKSNFNEILATNGFITGNRVMLSNILSLTPSNGRPTDIFEACILWAKHFCTENGKDAKNIEHLREAFGNSLYLIPFGSMKLEDFIIYYAQYKTLFKEVERDEIFHMIAKGREYTPKWFTLRCEDSNTENGLQHLVPEWNESKSILCIRYPIETGNDSSDVTVSSVLIRVQETSISCNRRALLGTVYCGKLKMSEVYVQEEIRMNLTINCCARKSGAHEIEEIFNKTKKCHVTRRNHIFFDFDLPILIEPEFAYKIKVEYFDEVFLMQPNLKNKVDLKEHTMIVSFHNHISPVASLIGLRLNVLDRKKKVNTKA